jgi:hypothetical protein
MTDEMPAEGKAGGQRLLLLRFLDFVLAEVDLPGQRGGTDVGGVEGFRDGDEADAGEVASSPGGGARDTFANVRQPGVNSVHYFGS